MGNPMKIRAAIKDGVTEVKILMQHDMETGMRKDADGVLVPAWFITDVKAGHQGRICQMAGAIPGDVKIHSKPVGRGYVHLREDQAHPWPRPNMPEKQIRAHEFHCSSLENLPADSRFAYHVERGYGIDGERDGQVLHNLLAS